MRMPNGHAGRLALLLILALTLSTVTGCAVGRREMPAITDLPETFSSTGEASLAEEWWVDFDDPALNAVIEEGLSGSPDLAVWFDRLDEAEALARKAGATWWPSVSVDGSASRSGQWDDGAPGTYSSSYSASGTISYEIDLWGRVRSTRHAAVYEAHSSREDVRAAVLSLSARVAATWYEIAEARSQVLVLGEQVVVNEQTLEIIGLRFRSGQISASDVLRQKQLLESSRGSLALAESRLEVLRNQLAVLVGRTPQDRVVDDEAALVALPPLPDTGIPAKLLQRRPDLRAAELDVAAASARLGAAVADRFPRVSITASVSSSAGTTADLFTSWLSNLVGNLTVPLIDGGARKAEAERQEALVDEALHRYRQAVLTGLQEVEDALTRESHQNSYLASVSEQLALANEILERNRDAYRGGQFDYLRVLDGLTLQQSLERQELTARRELIGYRIELCRALGGGWSSKTPAEGTAGSDGRTQS
ncbi:efflux transporter outer membrane subunit [bacterium]|nr:efflux transporter outer membrane subunit [bacterium]